MSITLHYSRYLFKYSADAGKWKKNQTSSPDLLKKITSKYFIIEGWDQTRRFRSPTHRARAHTKKQLRLCLGMFLAESFYSSNAIIERGWLNGKCDTEPVLESYCNPCELWIHLVLEIITAIKLEFAVSLF